MDQPANQGIVACILNERAGTCRGARPTERIQTAFLQHGLRVQTIVSRHGRELTSLARRAVKDGCRTIVAAGGDGTVSAIANAIVGTDAALGILPLGTLNHFAKDAGIPLDFDAAVQAIIFNETKLVDVGEVNGRIFINNSSIGLYPAVVRERVEHQKRGRSKWIAFAHAVLTVLRRAPSFHADLQAGGGRTGEGRTPFVFIGNNPYGTTGLEIGERQRLDKGTLWVCLAPGANRLALLKLALRAVLGLKSPGELKAFEAEELRVQTRTPRITVANDGEVYSASAPLQYRIRPKSLRLIVVGDKAKR